MAFLLFCALFAASGSIYASQAASDIDFSRSVTAAEYQGYLGQGFNANYFKRKGGPLPKYNPENIQILKDLGFRNLRIRCVASLYDQVGYHNETFRNEFLANLTKVIDDCIDNGIAPIVTFRHREIENRANEEDLQKYLEWWKIVAEELKDKSYLLSFNLFTEMGVEICRNKSPFCWENWRNCCAESLRLDTEKYHRWTSEVISIIRGTGGNNAQRILILASPRKTTWGLEPQFSDTIKSYMDSYMMMDWHNWAAGPNGLNSSRNYWSGKGTGEQKERIIKAILDADSFTARTGIPTYQGEWMPRDYRLGLLNQMEVMSFAQYFVELFKDAQIPWSLNSFDQYYDTETSTRRTEMQNHSYILGGTRIDFMSPLNMSLVLDTILDAI